MIAQKATEEEEKVREKEKERDERSEMNPKNSCIDIEIKDVKKERHSVKYE